MKRFLKWAAIAGGVLLIAGFVAFLYFMPPFTIVAPEAFSREAASAAPTVDDIKDPAERALAGRGRYLVIISGCNDCHATPGPQGPRADMYLGGGMKLLIRNEGTVVSGNLTPDPETGIGRRTDEELIRALRSGIFHDGRPMAHRAMPWPVYANWTDEDLRAVIAYLRRVKPVAHRIPDAVPDAPIRDPAAIEESYAGADYGVPPARR